MAITGLSVTKETSFRGTQQNFSNVYHYDSLSSVSPEQAEALLDAVVATERQMHAPTVTFIQGRVWSAGGTPGENSMIFEKALSGPGGGPADQEDLDLERAILIQWPAGQNTLGRPVYLRKWYHTCTNPAGGLFSDGVLANTAPMSQADRDAIATVFEQQRERVVAGVNFFLSSGTGRLAGQPARAYAWLEHHQLGDEWRAG